MAVSQYLIPQLQKQGQDFMQARRDKQKQSQMYEKAMMEALMKQQVAQQDPYKQMQTKLMKQFLGNKGLQGGMLPGGAGQGTPQPGQPQPFITKPSLTLGPSGPSIGMSQVENPEIKRRQQQLSIASGLRKEFNASKAFKDYETVNRSAKALEQAYKLAIRPGAQSRIASDQALGVLFQKILDPPSVVRESEYARTPEGTGLVNRMLAFWPKVKQGGMQLTNEDRFAIFEMSQKLLQGGQETFNANIDRYSNIAGLYQVDPKLIFGGIKKINIKDIAFQQSPTNGQPGISPEDTVVNQLLDQLGAK